MTALALHHNASPRPPSTRRLRSASRILLIALVSLLGTAPGWAAPNSLCGAVPPPPPASPAACPIGGFAAVQQMRAACAGKSTPAAKTPAPKASAPACAPVPSSPKAKAAYWQTLTVASGTVSEVAKLEGWSTANDPSQGDHPRGLL